MRQSRCVDVRHKAQGQLLRDQPFHQALRIREIPLPAGAATIRLRLGEMQRARESARRPRARGVGCQSRSNASHTGRQYCAVDSMTTSSTSCSTNHSARRRSWLGVVPTFRRSNGSPRRPRRRPPRPPASSCARRFLRSGTASALPGRERRACLVVSLRVAGYRQSDDAQLFAQSRTLRINQLIGLTGSIGLVRSRRSRRHYSRDTTRDFHPLSRADVSAWERADISFSSNME